MKDLQDETFNIYVNGIKLFFAHNFTFNSKKFTLIRNMIHQIIKKTFTNSVNNKIFSNLNP